MSEAGPDWYREREEPEQTFVGVLHERATGASPLGRTRLLFELDRSHGRRLPIYGPEAEEAMAELVGRHVRLRGRIVDLAEGFGPELWVAELVRGDP